MAEPTVSAAEPGDMIRPATVLRFSLILAIRRLMSWPLDFDISILTRRSSAKLFVGSVPILFGTAVGGK